MYEIISSFYFSCFDFCICETLIENHSCLGMRFKISAWATVKLEDWVFFGDSLYFPKIFWIVICTLWSAAVIPRQPSIKYWPLVHYLSYCIVHMIHQEPRRNSLIFLASTQSSLMYLLRFKFKARYCKDFKYNAIKSFCVFVKSCSLSHMYPTSPYYDWFLGFFVDSPLLLLEFTLPWE